MKSKTKASIAGVGIVGLIAGVVYLNDAPEPVRVEKAASVCAQYCAPHKGAELRATGEEIDGKPHVECWCKTADRGWKRNRTDMKMTDSANGN